MALEVQNRKCILLFFLLRAISDTIGLKDVAVTIPQAATVGDTVTLQCRYNLEGEPLYTVKWYKGQSEFYRFLPKELPNTQVFPLPGIDVDLSKSTPNEVVLRNVQPEVSGRYRCEVSTDSPNFFTNIETGYMYVINIPKGEPQMKIEKDSYEIGYTLRGNCTSPPAYPAVNLTWYINKKKVNESSLFYISDPSAAVEGRRAPKITVSGLELDIDGNTFQGGKARLQCVASLFHLYNSEAEIVLEEERPRPRPSSVLGTRDATSGSSSLLRCLIVNSAVLFRVMFR